MIRKYRRRWVAWIVARQRIRLRSLDSHIQALTALGSSFWQNSSVFALTEAASRLRYQIAVTKINNRHLWKR